MGDVTDRLVRRAAMAGLAVPPALVSRLTAYYELLAHWNEKVNLTSLVDPDLAVDRLIIEPLAAAAHLASRARLIDLGSGGGSPAIPLGLVLSAPKLVMVESRERKAAFLREAIRHLDLSDIATVEGCRFEELAGRDGFRQAFDLVSIRAVRMDAKTLTAAVALLTPGGFLALFRGPSGADRPDGTPQSLELVSSAALLKGSADRLTILRKTDGR